MSALKNEPLVSVGVPTYNRPAGLKRTLEFITKQTYKNLEIIISDNNSPNTEVEEVVQSFQLNDSRIIFYKQAENIGAYHNFKFVLKQAAGEHFMWAADDDEWDKDFIAHLLSISEGYSLAFCHFSFKYDSINKVEDAVNIKATFGNTKYEIAKNFLMERIPNMFYGLYKTRDIQWFCKYNKNYDWLDCYVTFRIILLHQGVIVSKRNLYTVGIPGDAYEYKPSKRRKDKLFGYIPNIAESLKIISESDLLLVQKIKLSMTLFHTNLDAYFHYEKGIRKNYNFHLILFTMYKWIRGKVRLL